MSDQHNSDDPMAFLNAIETIGLAATLPPCPHCTMTTKMLPMTGSGWGLDVIHEPECPLHEDNQPAHEVDFTDRPDEGGAA
jgi:hypothetical protein